MNEESSLYEDEIPEFIREAEMNHVALVYALGTKFYLTPDGLWVYKAGYMNDPGVIEEIIAQIPGQNRQVMQLHHDFFIWQKRWGVIDPIDEKNYTLAMARENGGIVKPFPENWWEKFLIRLLIPVLAYRLYYRIRHYLRQRRMRRY